MLQYHSTLFESLLYMGTRCIMNSETFTATFIEKRPLSIHIEHNGVKAFIPRSQIDRFSIENDKITMTIPTWLYNKNFE